MLDARLPHTPFLGRPSGLCGFFDAFNKKEYALETDDTLAADSQVLLDQVAKRIESRGLTQREVADALEINQSQLSKLLAGKSHPRPKLVLRIRAWLQGNPVLSPEELDILRLLRELAEGSNESMHLVGQMMHLAIKFQRAASS